MDADVICQPFLSEERQRMRETAHLLGPHVTCGTRFPGVSVISLEKRSKSSKGSLIKFWPFTLMNPGVLSLVTHLTDTATGQIPYATTTKTKLLKRR